MNRTQPPSFPGKRIVSLVPSQTELLFDLGLDEEVVGITKFCIHPQTWFRKKQRVGGTKTVKTDTVKALQPDLIIANKEENVKAQIEELEQIATVWVSDIKTLEDAIEMILSVGKLVGREDPANKLVEQIREAFKQIEPLPRKLNTAYFIWKDPYMVAGGDTFINDLLNRCGFSNIFQHTKRYPEVSINKFSIVNAAATVNSHISAVTDEIDNCELLLLSSEPYPFKQKHIDELQKMLPHTKIMLVDGEMFSWYGSRLRYSAEYFKNLIKQIQG